METDKIRLLIQALETFLIHCSPDDSDYARSDCLLGELKAIDKETPIV